MFSALEDIAPNYVKKVPGNLYDKGNANVHKTIDVLRGVRIAYINEMTTVEKNTEMLKDIADGKSFPYNKMYGVQQNMLITFKQFIVSNHTINCMADNGIARRLKQMQMNSKFVKEGEGEENPARRIFRAVHDFDRVLCETYKHALLHLLFSYATKFVQNNHVKEKQPEVWAQEGKETMESNDKFKEWFDSTFDIASDFEIAKHELEDLIAKKFKGRHINFKDQIKKNGWSFTYDCKKKLHGGKGVWKGFQVMEDEVVCS